MGLMVVKHIDSPRPLHACFESVGRNKEGIKSGRESCKAPHGEGSCRHFSNIQNLQPGLCLVPSPRRGVNIETVTWKPCRTSVRLVRSQNLPCAKVDFHFRRQLFQRRIEIKDGVHLNHKESFVPCLCHMSLKINIYRYTLTYSKYHSKITF